MKPIHRRTFLKSVLVVAAAGAASACGDDDAGTTDVGASDAGDDLRDDTAMSDVSDAADATDADDIAPPRPVVEDATRFPQGVASGDPRDDGFVLWTRLAAGATAAAQLRLELATDPDFDHLITLSDTATQLIAEPAFDGCVKARVVGLSPATPYFYRFVIDGEDASFASRTGRAMTAPDADDERTVRFAYVSCQSYAGRYFTPYRRLVDEPIDLVVHLGDYIYETTNDPSFQDAGGRQITFDDLDGAIPLGDPEAPYFAARSLDNYRQLYRTYRLDPDLQEAHARLPFVTIWDDHEFTNDAHGATGTYHNGREDETDVQRRQNASQAWYEYTPVDYLDDPDFVYDADVPFPNDIRIWRDLRMGKHVHLVMTDLRSYRADHVINEDLSPGRIVMTEDDLLGSGDGTIPTDAVPYVDITEVRDGAYALALDPFRTRFELTEDDLTGWVSVPWLHQLVDRLRDEGEELDLDRIESNGLPRGIAGHSLGKRSKFTSLGSRSLVVRDTFERYAAWKWEQTEGESEMCMGEEQEAWFLSTISGSTATWKVWGNQYMLMPLSVDLRTFASLPPEFAQRFLLSTEDWSGFPNRRELLLRSIGAVENVVAITGDVHAFFAGQLRAEGDPDASIVELVTGAISTRNYRGILFSTANSDPALAQAGAPALAFGIDALFMDPATQPNPHMAAAASDKHGYVVVHADASELTARNVRMPESVILNEPASMAELEREIEEHTFVVRSGDRALYRRAQDGSLSRWDVDTVSWTDG